MDALSPLAATDALFFGRPGAELDRDTAFHTVASALEGLDDGELFLEYRESESLSLEEGRIRSAGFDTSMGFGLRAVLGEEAGYAHAGEISASALNRAASTVSAVRAGRSGALAAPPRSTNTRLYSDANPLHGTTFADRTGALARIDAYARGKDPRVKQVMASLSGEWQAVQIMRPDGTRVADLRPLVRLGVNVVVEQDGRRESGHHGAGGRFGYDQLIDEAFLKKTSAFSGRRGQRSASPGGTVVDDGTLPDRRGSITVDDEGTPSGRTVMIEDGILTGFIQDRMNARLMGVSPTGNGRRQSYAHVPMPRMTNTIMLGGQATPDDMIRSVKNGLYAVNFGGGQVDITSGKFVFSASEAYLIEDGRVTAPVKGATLIGNGPDALTRIEMVGNDPGLDPGIGTCGKNGQGVPVGVGQPTIKLSGLTVGGTAT